MTDETQTKKPRRNLSITEKLRALRDQKRAALDKLAAREQALSKQLEQLSDERARAARELERIEAACGLDAVPEHAAAAQ